MPSGKEQDAQGTDSSERSNNRDILSLMKGVILAAGKGTRLFPATKHIPKSLLPLANRMTLEYGIDRLRDIGVTEICLIVSEDVDEVLELIGDGRRFGVRFSICRQTEPLGLAHALSFAEDFVQNEPFVMLLGDLIFEGDFRAFAKKFLESGAANLSVVKWVDDPSRFGVANLDGDRIVRLVEKPEKPESNFATTGLYFFGPQIWSVLQHLSPSHRGEYEISDAIQYLVEQGETCLAKEYVGEWFDTGTLDSFLATNAFLVNHGRLIDRTAKVDARIGNGVVVGAGARVRAAELRDCVILPGARIEVTGTIEHSILGGNVQHDDDIKGLILYPDPEPVAHPVKAKVPAASEKTL